MSKRFQRGLVVGKFSPLHLGHELLINRAFEECAEVILLCYSKPELPGCDAGKREHWLNTLFPNARRLIVTDERLQQLVKPGEGPREVPHNDAEELTHRRFCGFLCRRILGVTVDAVFTSEDYGDGFAEELTRYFRESNPKVPNVKHMLVDKHRSRFPVSGIQLRCDIHGQRDWLSRQVYASFIERVCLLGGESSGKSTLAAALANAMQTVYAPEYGRDLWEEKAGQLRLEDMLHIANTQVKREEEAALRANQYVFCDTSPLTTLFYSHHLFGKAEPELELLANREYKQTVLCAPDFQFVQDGTRQTQEFRLHQHEWYLTELRRRKIPYLLATGSVENRIQQVKETLVRQLSST